MAEASAPVARLLASVIGAFAAVAGLMPSAALPPVENEAARQLARPIVDRHGRGIGPRSCLPGKVAQRLISQIRDKSAPGYDWKAQAHTLPDRTVTYSRPVGTPPIHGQTPGGLFDGTTVVDRLA